MFGTLKPSFAGLRCGARQDWQHFYCGTCQSLGDHFGLAYRGLLSHDAVFLALLVDGLGVSAAGPSRTRCPMLPVLHKATVSPDSVAMRYAAAIQLLLADQWLADRAVDGKAVARAARPLVERRSEQARATLRELGSDLDALIGFEHIQAEVEALEDWRVHANGPYGTRTLAESIRIVPGASGSMSRPKSSSKPTASTMTKATAC